MLFLKSKVYDIVDTKSKNIAGVKPARLIAEVLLLSIFSCVVYINVSFEYSENNVFLLYSAWYALTRVSKILKHLKLKLNEN
ncbi:hypothetical protein QWZ13_19355 [Reinekea marina]|uniref:hypothetical protein n=1 Tax=Reinekea marina TaxID=1310421 RepID=UPI0025B2B264|nr:hypothetical protein [Reinekea marina]MDN3647317.1 hypothetical protein [Reinekea marina]MDN3651073.1 hypothetical protein [Reinekea marina]